MPSSAPGAPSPAWRVWIGLWLAFAALGALPWLLSSDYHLSLLINLLMYSVLASAWALFSGPTGYMSLATVAFFGLGAYSCAAFGELLAWPWVLAVAAASGLALALLVGLATLRLSGVYFVIFSFGLAELSRQLVTWWEINQHQSVGRYVFIDISQRQIYWQLLAMLALVLGLRAWLQRSRLGLALRVIGQDELVAEHLGIATARVKVLLFSLSGMLMSLNGAIMAPRWTYIDPSIAFAPEISFQTLIMALLGGSAAWLGPVLGAVPLVLLFELLSANFPNHFSIALGLIFMLIVYLLPRGLIGLLDRRRP